MVNNYNDIKDSNFIGADKYFHYKGNCEAATRGQVGVNAATIVSNGREIVNTQSWIRSNRKHDRLDRCADQRANRYGRTGVRLYPNNLFFCSGVCSTYRPDGLPTEF